MSDDSLVEAREVDDVVERYLTLADEDGAMQQFLLLQKRIPTNEATFRELLTQAMEKPRDMIWANTAWDKLVENQRLGMCDFVNILATAEVITEQEGLDMLQKVSACQTMEALNEVRTKLYALPGVESITFKTALLQERACFCSFLRNPALLRTFVEKSGRDATDFDRDWPTLQQYLSTQVEILDGEIYNA